MLKIALNKKAYLDTVGIIATLHKKKKKKFAIKDFFSKCDQIQIWSHLLKKSLMENFIFCAVQLLMR